MVRNITSDWKEVDGKEHCIGMGWEVDGEEHYMGWGGQLMVRSITWDGRLNANSIDWVGG